MAADDRHGMTVVRAVTAVESATAGEPRPPASVLGMLLERDGADSVGLVLAGLVMRRSWTRVLLAHRLG
jgi:hypothetical protein